MKQISLFCAAALVLFSGVTASAQITGEAYSVPTSTSYNVPTQGNVPGPNATPWATFNSSALLFTGDPSGDYSLGGFLNSFGVAYNINYLNGASASSDLTSVLFEFTGSAVFTNGESFTAYHDDGVNLYVNGNLILGDPGPTAPTLTPYTYNGPSGTFPFDFIYANGPCCNADFQTDLVTSTTVVGNTPEPSSIALLGTGVLGVVGAIRRRIRKS